MAEIANLLSRGSVDALRSFVARIQAAQQEIDAVNFRKRQIYDGVRGAGFDTKTLKRVVRNLGRDASEYEEGESLYASYARALGLPVAGGVAGQTADRGAASRAHEGKPPEQAAAGFQQESVAGTPVNGGTRGTEGGLINEPDSPADPELGGACSEADVTEDSRVLARIEAAPSLELGDASQEAEGAPPRGETGSGAIIVQATCDDPSATPKSETSARGPTTSNGPPQARPTMGDKRSDCDGSTSDFTNPKHSDPPDPLCSNPKLCGGYSRLGLCSACKVDGTGRVHTAYAVEEPDDHGPTAKAR